MRDYYYLKDSGQRIAVADLPTAEIQDLLQYGLVIVNSDHPTETEEAVRERLLIELDIRKHNL